ncbi:M48 family metallopeptidase [candidate division FCPU426 bacterium]|nr:M48 family metallopeptidase [candidate division FCPU426 bacterium]
MPMTGTKDATVMAGMQSYVVRYNHSRYVCLLLPNRRNRHVRLRIVPGQPSPADHAAACCCTETHSEYGQLHLFWVPAAVPFIVQVTYPPTLARREVCRLVDEHAAWIARQCQRLIKETSSFARQRLPGKNKLLYRGKVCRLVVVKDTRRETAAWQDGCMVLRLHSDEREYVNRYIHRWFTREALRVIGRRIQEIGAPWAGKPFRIRINNPKTRWGSCSARGTLSFSWKLLMAPDYVCDYILVHELAHLQEMNHSARFWKLVSDHGANVKRAKLWLKTNGRKLDMQPWCR